MKRQSKGRALVEAADRIIDPQYVADLEQRVQDLERVVAFLIQQTPPPGVDSPRAVSGSVHR